MCNEWIGVNQNANSLINLIFVGAFITSHCPKQRVYLILFIKSVDLKALTEKMIAY